MRGGTVGRKGRKGRSKVMRKKAVNFAERRCGGCLFFKFRSELCRSRERKISALVRHNVEQ